MKTMSKKPDARYQSAAALADEIESHLSGVPAEISGFGQSRWIAAGIVLIAAAMAIIAMMRFWPGTQARDTLAGAANAAPGANAAAVSVAFDVERTRIESLDNGQKCYLNRPYRIEHLPPEMIGLSFTQRAGGKPSAVQINASAGATVYVLVNSDSPINTFRAAADVNKRLAGNGWERLGDADYGAKYPLAVYRQRFPAQRRVTLDGAFFSGFIVAARNLTIAGEAKPGTNPVESNE